MTSFSKLQAAVREVLERSAHDEVMIDALFQWSTNPTSMSAGWGLEENYPYIGKNLKLRYQLSDAEVNARVKELRETCERLIESAQDSGIEPIADGAVRIETIVPSDNRPDQLRTRHAESDEA